MAACVERRAACGASYNACASGATPCKFETRQPARPAGKAKADRQFQRRVSPRTDLFDLTTIGRVCCTLACDESGRLVRSERRSSQLFEGANRCETRPQFPSLKVKVISRLK